MKILFAASEAFPFIKTGGLGDVVHSLPEALNRMGEDVRVVLPAYRDVMQSVEDVQTLGSASIIGVGVSHHAEYLQARDRETGHELLLVDIPVLYGRPGNPYVDEDGREWPDNAERFTVFSRAVAQMAGGIPGTDWKPDVVHVHDWQTALVPAFVSLMDEPPLTVFTIHNMSYDGYFSQHDFDQLGLPAAWWSADAVEFYGGFSMLKAGIVFSDYITTVSPTYAEEICTLEYGYRFEGLLKHSQYKLSGILNGIDLDVWDPERDPFLKVQYTELNRHKAKLVNKTDLLEQIGLEADNEPLLGFVGRLVAQKGIDLMLAIMPELFEETDAKVVVLGSGEDSFEQGLLAMAARYPERLHVHIGYSEALAHKIEAGCDLFLMPSRFEPCGLNQMYSLRYGTPPLVNHTGGLADTVVDTTLVTLRDKSANGFVFYDASAHDFLKTIRYALSLFDAEGKRLWQQVCRAGMQIDFSWDKSAQAYLNIYQSQSRAQQ